MKITKHLHSCLLIKENGTVILIDPGNYTFEEKALDIGKMEKLDLILITHEHQDHIYMPFLKEILAKFPQAKIITNPSVAGILQAENISSSSEGNDAISFVPAPHELLLGGRSAENYVFNIFGKLTHPGDSLQFERSLDVLALPIQAPWGSMVASVEKAALLKPKIIIPIHDWHWKDNARKRMYEMARGYLAEKGIEIKALELGEEFST